MDEEEEQYMQSRQQKRPHVEMDLQGILFVARTGSEGVKLLVKYPPGKRREVSDETLKSCSTEHRPQQQQGWGRKSGSDVHRRLRHESDMVSFSAYDISAVNLAPLLIPNKTLLNSPMTLGIDDGVFIGYPTSLEPGPGAMTMTELVSPALARRTPGRSQSSSGTANIGNSLSASDEIKCLRKTYSEFGDCNLCGDDPDGQFDEALECVFNDETATTATTITNNSNINNSSSGGGSSSSNGGSVSSLSASSTIATVPSKSPPSVTSGEDSAGQTDSDDSNRSKSSSYSNLPCASPSERGGSNAGGGKSDVLAFNIVFAFKAGKDIHKAEHRLQGILRDISDVFLQEEKRCRWVSTEIEKILKARDLWLMQQSTPEKKDIKPSWLDYVEYLLEISPLCVQLAKVYRRVRYSGSAQLFLNEWTPLGISMWDPSETLIPALRPYHTIFLTDHDLDDLSQRATPSMKLFITHARPSKSFLDLHYETGISLKYIYKMASNLVFWRGAIVMHTLAEDSRFVLNPRPLLPMCSYNGSLATKFASECPHLKFTELLAKFQEVKTLEQHLTTVRLDLEKSSPSATEQTKEFHSRTFVQSLCWLLSHGLIVQLQECVYSLGMETKSVGKLLNYPLFRKLVRRGSTINEIKWRTNMTRSQVLEHAKGDNYMIVLQEDYPIKK